MSIQHHPSEELLTAFAAGTLDRGQHIAAATHLGHCPACRGWVKSVENVGGAVLAELPPAPMAPDALSRIAPRLAEAPHQSASRRDGDSLPDVPGLPAFVRALPAEPWVWVAPSLHVRRIELGGTSPTRVFLLKSGPGTKLLPHTHTGFELTCVLTGSFTHDNRRYAVGDFDMGTPEDEHEIEIGTDEACISLVAMQGTLRLKGVFGRLLQPLISF